MKLSYRKRKEGEREGKFSSSPAELILFQQQTNGGEHVIARNYL